MITQHASETGAKIPANLSLDERQIQQRFEAYYAPYQSALKDLIQSIRAI